MGSQEVRTVRQFRWMINDIINTRVPYLIAKDYDYYGSFVFESHAVIWEIGLRSAKTQEFSFPNHHLLEYIKSSSKRRVLADILCYACTLDDPKAFLERPMSHERLLEVQKHAAMLRPIVDAMTA